MFNFFNSKPFTPSISPGNPGQGTELEVAFTNSERTWVEKVNLLDLLSSVLRLNSVKFQRQSKWLVLDNGITLQPLIVSFQPLEPSGVQTLTSIQACHEQYFPKGLFEYQHSTGDNLQDSFLKGFESWLSLDLPVLIDAVTEKLETCTAMEISFPENKFGKGFTRQILLGNPAHFAEFAHEATEHPFCPCCLFTNSFKAFEKLVDSDSFYGIRLFAARDSNGIPQADCRVNGEDWEAGAEALKEYARTWTGNGIEFRKQFIVIKSISDRSQRIAANGKATVR